MDLDFLLWAQSQKKPTEASTAATVPVTALPSATQTASISSPKVPSTPTTPQKTDGPQSPPRTTPPRSPPGKKGTECVEASPGRKKRDNIGSGGTPSIMAFAIPMTMNLQSNLSPVSSMPPTSAVTPMQTSPVRMHTLSPTTLPVKTSVLPPATSAVMTRGPPPTTSPVKAHAYTYASPTTTYSLPSITQFPQQYVVINPQVLATNLMPTLGPIPTGTDSSASRKTKRPDAGEPGVEPPQKKRKTKLTEEERKQKDAERERLKQEQERAREEKKKRAEEERERIRQQREAEKEAKKREKEAAREKARLEKEKEKEEKKKQREEEREKKLQEKEAKAAEKKRLQEEKKKPGSILNFVRPQTQRADVLIKVPLEAKDVPKTDPEEFRRILLAQEGSFEQLRAQFLNKPFRKEPVNLQERAEKRKKKFFDVDWEKVAPHVLNRKLKYLMWDEDDEEGTGVFHGTWGKTISVGPRNPFKEDPNFDYSESEDWEALTVGVEDLEAGSDGEDSEDSQPNEYNFNEEGFLVPDEYLSDDEGMSDVYSEAGSDDEDADPLLTPTQPKSGKQHFNKQFLLEKTKKNLSRKGSRRELKPNICTNLVVEDGEDVNVSPVADGGFYNSVFVLEATPISLKPVLKTRRKYTRKSATKSFPQDLLAKFITAVHGQKNRKMRVDEFVKQHEGRISKSLAIATAREAFKKLESKPCIWVASPEFLKQHNLDLKLEIPVLDQPQTTSTSTTNTTTNTISASPTKLMPFLSFVPVTSALASPGTNTNVDILPPTVKTIPNNQQQGVKIKDISNNQQGVKMTDVDLNSDSDDGDYSEDIARKC